MIRLIVKSYMVIWEILYGNDTACRGFIAELSYSKFGVPVVIEPTTLSNHLLEALCPIHFTIVLYN